MGSNTLQLKILIVSLCLLPFALFASPSYAATETTAVVSNRVLTITVSDSAGADSHYAFFDNSGPGGSNRVTFIMSKNFDSVTGISGWGGGAFLTVNLSEFDQLIFIIDDNDYFELNFGGDDDGTRWPPDGIVTSGSFGQLGFVSAGNYTTEQSEVIYNYSAEPTAVTLRTDLIVSSTVGGLFGGANIIFGAAGLLLLITIPYGFFFRSSWRSGYSRD